jgi:hypothetical protein
MEAVLKIENGNFQVSVKDKVLDEGTLMVKDGKLRVNSPITGNWRCDIRVAPDGRAFTLVHQTVELEYRRTD